MNCLLCSFLSGAFAGVKQPDYRSSFRWHAAFSLKKVKGEQGHYFLYHVMYWYLPTMFHLKKTPPSYIREWVG